MQDFLFSIDHIKLISSVVLLDHSIDSFGLFYLFDLSAGRLASVSIFFYCLSFVSG